VLSASELSIVATPESLTTDLRLLTELSARERSLRIDPDSLPIAWRNGSAAVLFHESIGHPAERGLLAPSIPPWLRVADTPASGELVCMTVDDIGTKVGAADLTAGEPPAAFRRWSYRDVPARRLTNLVVSTTGTPLAALPDTRIDVLLASDGWWDPATDSIGVRVVAADLVEAGRTTPVEPFVYSTSREELFPLLAGWFGSATRHPGVLCGDEGVSLPVGSVSPGILTEAR